MRYCICMVTNFLSQKIVTGLATPLYKTIKVFLFSDTHQATLKYFHKLWWTGGGDHKDLSNAKVFSFEQIKAYCLQLVDKFQTLFVSEEVLFYLTYPSITQTRGCMATITKYIGMFSIMSLGNCSGVFSFFQTCEFLS